MLRIALLTSIFLLTACGHYKSLKQEHNNPIVNNRYSQTGVVVNQEQKSPSHIQSIVIVKKQTINLSENNNPDTLQKTIQPKDKPYSLQRFINIFIPEQVKSWQKSTLAKATMKAGGLTPSSEKFNQKVYSSKESSRGGLGVAGGGCGCN